MKSLPRFLRKRETLLERVVMLTNQLSRVKGNVLLKKRWHVWESMRSLERFIVLSNARLFGKRLLII